MHVYESRSQGFFQMPQRHVLWLIAVFSSVMPFFGCFHYQGRPRELSTGMRKSLANPVQVPSGKRPENIHGMEAVAPEPSKIVKSLKQYLSQDHSMMRCHELYVASPGIIFPSATMWSFYGIGEGATGCRDLLHLGMLDKNATTVSVVTSSEDLDP